MDNFGFIHGELDIKILILFILRRLPRPVDAETLSELTRSCDSGIGWFDYAQCLSALVDTGHADQLEGSRYLITEKGARNGETTESSLPWSVRTRAETRLKPVAEKMRRDSMIDASHQSVDGACVVSLSLSDGKGELASLRLLVADEAQAETVEKNFRRDAEGVYGKLIDILSEKQE